MKKVFHLLMLLISVQFIFSENSYLYLNGNGAFVELPGVIIDSESFTIEAWAKTMGEGGGIENQNILFEQRDDPTGDGHSTIILMAERMNTIPDARFGVRGDNAPITVVETGSYEYGGWHHYAGVVSPKGIILYIDGVMVDSTSNDQTGSFSNSIDHVDIGRHQHDNMSFGFFNGYIDEMKIWSFGRTQETIIANMNSSEVDFSSNLVAYWNFDDGTANDLSPYGHDGTLQNGATIVSGTYEELCSLEGDANNDGEIDVIDIISVVNLILIGQTNITHNYCVDLDQSSDINVMDIQLILNIILQ